MPDASALDDLADELFLARGTVRTLDPPSSRYPGFSVADGYEVARRLQRRREAAGARVVGAKLGFTTTAVWELLGIDRPFWAPVYDDTVSDARAVSLHGLAAPRLEPEIVVGLGERLEADAAPADIERAVSWAALGFELAQCRYPDWLLAAGDAVADAGLHGLLVVGERVDVAGRLDELAGVEVELSCDGAMVARGRSTDVLGGPLVGLAWLVQLPGFTALPAGAIVTTGSLTAPAPVSAGQTWVASALGSLPLGALELALEAAPGSPRVGPVQSPS